MGSTVMLLLLPSSSRVAVTAAGVGVVVVVVSSIRRDLESSTTGVASVAGCDVAAS